MFTLIVNFFIDIFFSVELRNMFNQRQRFKLRFRDDLTRGGTHSSFHGELHGLSRFDLIGMFANIDE